MKTKDRVAKLLLIAKSVEEYFNLENEGVKKLKDCISKSEKIKELEDFLESNNEINKYIFKDDRLIIKLGIDNKRIEIDKEGYISGEAIADYLGVSRVSVWKAINSLEEEGYVIHKRRNKGYRIESSKNLSSFKYRVKSNMKTDFVGDNLIYLETVDSTNTYLSKIAHDVSEGSVVISRKQTKGKGRVGRVWESNEGGIYISILLKPRIELNKVGFITQIAGASIIKVLKELGIDSLIKWPNDIILNNKKIAGILTELNAEIDGLNYVIVGIGINHIQRNFDEEISEKATSILNEGYDIEAETLVSKFLEIFEKLYKSYLDGDKTEVLSIIRDNSAVLGREIYLISDKRNFVRVLDIDDEGRLEVKFLDGSQRIEKIFTGEVSLRGKDRYI